MEKIKLEKENFDLKKELAQKLFGFVEYRLVRNSGDIDDYAETKKKFDQSVSDKIEFVSELRKNGDKKLADFIEEVFK